MKHLSLAGKTVHQFGWGEELGIKEGNLYGAAESFESKLVHRRCQTNEENELVDQTALDIKYLERGAEERAVRETLT